MVNPALLDSVTHLSADDRLELMGALADSLEHDLRDVSAQEAALLDERLAAHRADPPAGRPLTEVLSDLRRRLP